MQDMEKSKRVITSVKIPDVLYEDFKVMSVRTKISLQDIVERTMFLYLTNNDYRMKMHETYSTYYTGSHLLK
jgi:hypothetical protein